MGLPGSGKTTLANEIAPMLNAKRLNADEVRKEANDWDFSDHRSRFPDALNHVKVNANGRCDQRRFKQDHQ